MRSTLVGSTTNHQAYRLRRRLLLLLLLGSVALLSGAAAVRQAGAAAGDFTAINFVAAAPFTYNHATGGGAFDDATVGDNADIVNQLEGGRFSCYDVVTFLTAVEVSPTPVDPVQAAEFDYRFLANTTGQTGAAIADILQVRVNYGPVAGGDGAGGRDAGLRDDGGSQATLVRKQLSGPLYGASSVLQATVRVTDLEAGERVIVRIDARLSCKPNSNPTGNLQAQIETGRVVGTNAVINVGAQTIPFLRIDDVAGTGEPLLYFWKTVTEPGVACAQAQESLTTYQGEAVKYCYVVGNYGTQPLLDVALRDDNATPAATADDFDVTLAGLRNLDGQADRLDLAPGELATGDKTLTLNTVGTAVNTATATGNNGFSGSNYKDLLARDTATVIVQAIPTELTWQTETLSVAYEDLKNVGWSDWDYNDLIVRMTIQRGVNYKNNLAQLVITYDTLARGANFNHQFIHKLPLAGGGTAELVVRNAAGQVIRQETIPFGTLASFSIFERTRDALPPPAGFFDTNTRLSQPQAVAGHTATLTVTPASPAANPVAALPPAPWDPYIYVYNTGAEVHLVMPGHLDNTQTVNAAYDPQSPLIGYDLPLAQVFDAQWRWPIEFAGLWRAYPAYASFIGSGGTQNQNWYAPQRANAQWLWLASRLGGNAPEPRTATAETFLSRYFAGPVVADLDGDGQAEIILGNLTANRVEVYGPRQQARPGWPRSAGAGVKAPVTTADLDGDGQQEIIAGAEDGRLYAWRADGAPVAGWPVTLDPAFRVLATPAAGNLTGDPTPEIVVPLSNGMLYAVSASGTLLPGWPVSIGGVPDQYNSQVINSSPRLADLDGDGRSEIVVGSTDRKLYALNADGTVRWTSATGDMVLSSPVVADIDPARPGPEIAFGSGDSFFYLLDRDGQLLWKRPTGWTLRASPVAADLDGDGDLELLIGGDDDKLWAWHHDGRLVAGWPQQASADLFASVVVGDIDGDQQPEVVVGSDDARVYAWHADGRLVDGWPRQTGLSVKGRPALANLDGDPELEVVAADFNGSLYIWNVESYSFFLPLAVRP